MTMMKAMGARIKEQRKEGEVVQAECVAKGAALLDKKYPGWATMVDVEELVNLAQLSYLPLLRMIYKNDRDPYKTLGLGTSFCIGMEYGFEAHDLGLLIWAAEEGAEATSLDWVVLAELWKAEIEKRREHFAPYAYV